MDCSQGVFLRVQGHRDLFTSFEKYSRQFSSAIEHLKTLFQLGSRKIFFEKKKKLLFNLCPVYFVLIITVSNVWFARKA